MDEEKFCPLKQVADIENPSYYRQCDKEKCACWDIAYTACSLSNISYFLGEIANSLDKRNQFL